MNRTGSLVAFLVLASALLPSCSPLSKSVRQVAESGVSFETIRQNPERYIGKRVVLGGYILEVKNLPTATRLTILQTPLDYQDRPKAKEDSHGRFVVARDGFLDPAVFETDRMLTVAGVVQGRETIMIDGYSYPTIALNPIEMHLWEKEVPGGYPYYYPFYDPFYYDPFYRWYGDPFFRRPVPRRR
jgi:outer membrane lipoprotein